MELADFHEIKDRRLHLLQTEKWADCRFLVGTPANQKIIAGHKLVLALASPVFERIFYGQLADKDDPIVIPDVQPEAFQAMLEYIYSDRINIGSFDKAWELCYVAKKYMLPNVVEQCTKYLCTHLSPKNACRVDEFAKLIDEPRLMQGITGEIWENFESLWAHLSLNNVCWAYEFAKVIDQPRLMQSIMGVICRNIKDVLEDPSFTDIEVSTLMDILDQDKLGICSELDLFNALLRYSNFRGMFLDELSYAEWRISIEAGDMNAQRLIVDEDMLRQAVKKIRFLTMTPKQFSAGPALAKILEQHEALAILIKISSPSNNDCPMPEGFCSSRSDRIYYDNRRYNKEDKKLILDCPQYSPYEGSPWLL